MSRKIVRKLETVLDRRNFLSKVTMVAGAFVAGVFGVTQRAYACVNCCRLCFTPGTCDYSGCAAEWGWNCDDRTNCLRARCWECYEPGYPANGGCAGVKCSKTQKLGRIPGCIPA